MGLDYHAIVGPIKRSLAFKDMLLKVLARAANTIGTIIAHPIAFWGNLVDAGKLGFTNTGDRIAMRYPLICTSDTPILRRSWTLDESVPCCSKDISCVPGLSVMRYPWPRRG